MSTEASERVVDEFIAALVLGDVDQIVELFSDDAVYHPRPMSPAVGKPAIRRMLTEWFSVDYRTIKIDVHRTLSDERVVMHERTDVFVLNGQEFEHPTAVTFEIDGDGKLTACREYFDMSPFVTPQT